MENENSGMRKVDCHGIRKGDYVETKGNQGGMFTANLRGIVKGLHLDPYTRECVATMEPENMADHHRGDFESIVWPTSDLRAIDPDRSNLILASRMKEIERKLGIKVS